MSPFRRRDFKDLREEVPDEMESSVDKDLIGERSEAAGEYLSGVRVRNVVVVMGFRGLKKEGNLENAKRVFVGVSRLGVIEE